MNILFILFVFYIFLLFSLKQTLKKQTNPMINDLFRMAEALTPPMYRYMRMYIRFLLPEKDRPLEEVLKFLRTNKYKDPVLIEQKLRAKYRIRKLRYFCERLWWLMEEVRLDPLQPWNQKLFQINDMMIQRKLLGGMCLAVNGFKDSAVLRFNQAHTSAAHESSGNPAIKLQTSWFNPGSNEESPQVQERIGVLVHNYMTAVTAKHLLYHTFRTYLVEGAVPEQDALTISGEVILPEAALAYKLKETIYYAKSGNLDLFKTCLPECEAMIAKLATDDPLIHPLLLLRSGLWLSDHAESRKLSEHMLFMGLKDLPSGHFLYAESLKCLFILYLTSGSIIKAEQLILQYGQNPVCNEVIMIIHVFRSLLAFVKEDSRKALQHLRPVSSEMFSDPSIRIYEIMILLDQEEFQSANCRIESLRKLLARRGENDTRFKKVLSILTRVESRVKEYRLIQKECKSTFQLLSDSLAWSPRKGELIPLETWFYARSQGKKLLQYILNKG